MILQLKNREICNGQTFDYSGNQLKIINGDQYNNCVFNDCVFDSSTIYSVSFFLCEFNKCSFVHADVFESAFLGCEFNLCNFNYAKISVNNIFDRHNRFIDCLNIKTFRQIKDLIVNTQAA